MNEKWSKAEPQARRNEHRRRSRSFIPSAERSAADSARSRPHLFASTRYAKRASAASVPVRLPVSGGFKLWNGAKRKRQTRGRVSSFPSRSGVAAKRSGVQRIETPESGIVRGGSLRSNQRRHRRAGTSIVTGAIASQSAAALFGARGPRSAACVAWDTRRLESLRAKRGWRGAVLAQRCLACLPAETRRERSEAVAQPAERPRKRSGRAGSGGSQAATPDKSRDGARCRRHAERERQRAHARGSWTAIEHTLPSAAAGRSDCPAEDRASRGRSSKSRRQTRCLVRARSASSKTSRVSGEVVTPTARMKAFERRDGLDNTTRVQAWRRVESRAL